MYWSVFERLVSIFMGFGSLLLVVNLWLLWSQRRRDVKSNTAYNILNVVYPAIIKFEKWSANGMPNFNHENKEEYRENVEPYINLLFWLYFQLKNGLLNKKIIITYTPQIFLNYEKIKEYISLSREQYGTTALIEIDKLMKILKYPNSDHQV